MKYILVSTLLIALFFDGAKAQSNQHSSEENTTRLHDELNLGHLSPDAPPETQQFGQLVGSWAIADESLQPDGTWAEGPGADWIWRYILDGHAIQDDWISPPIDRAAGRTQRQFGTNIRIYNPASQSWDMAWTSTTDQHITSFSAKAVNNEIIMQGEWNGRDSRITFYNITTNTFEWKLEIRGDNAGSWTEIYRIFASRKE